MATASVSSTQITNRDAAPRVLNNARITRGAVQSSCGTCEAGAADSIGSKYKLCSVPSNARMVQLLLSCDTMGTSGAADIGIYQTTDNGSAVVDADFFASAQALTSALKNSDVLFESDGTSSANDISKVEMPLWQALGLTADPKRDYDIVATLTAATVSAGTISLQANFCI
jgi:hypothetical protein